MKISWNWLGELVELPADATAVARRLTIAGLEVETVTELGTSFSGVVVAEILGKRPHPGSKKLTLVTVTDGTQRAEVVCGAPNVPDAGARVLWAQLGSRLPGGREITLREVAGIASPGMLCSETELGLGGEGGGIVILAGEDAAAVPGTLAQEALALRDLVLDIATPANRPDCLGHIGIAREVAALYGTRLRRPEVPPATGARAAGELARVRIDDPEGCPRYTARVIEGVTVGPSPRWMRRRLEAVGLRPISSVVDATNYVMMELGHPLHAFDLDTLRGEIVVRRARHGERLRTLDGQDRELVAGDLLICDDSGPIALGGVMGGAATEVTASTRRVLLEAATFDPLSVRRTSRRLQLPSEAAYRYERGVDAAGVDFASARTAALMGGQVARGVVDVYPRPAQPVVLELRPARANAVLGTDLPTSEISRCLRALELDVDDTREPLRVTVPTVRRDLEREIDLIEEVARVHGLDDLPATLPAALAPPEEGDESKRADLARDLLAAAGLDEAICFAFTSRARIAALRLPPTHLVAQPLAVENPMRPEQEVMRTSLVPNLLASLAGNLAFGAPSVRLFEVGHVFLRSGRELPDEPLFAAGVLCGERPGWLQSEGTYDFFDAKGAVERLLEGLRADAELVPARLEEGFLHPGVAAAVVIGGVSVGVVGEVHPETRERLGIDKPCFAFELCLDRIPVAAPKQLRPISRFPAILRDVSFFVDDFVPAARIRSLILGELGEGRPDILEDVRVLEDYRETGKVPPGKKGMLWSLTYRGMGRTLTDAEVDAAHESLVTRLLAALRAERR